MAITKFTDVADTGYDSAINTDSTLQTERDKFLQGLVTKIDELTDLLNNHITDMAANNAKTSFPGFGTTNKTALAGDTTTISTAQANAITANTAKVSMVIGTGKGEAMSGQTNIPTVTVNSGKNLEVMFDNLKIGIKTTTIDLLVTDTSAKKTYTATITLQ